MIVLILFLGFLAYSTASTTPVDVAQVSAFDTQTWVNAGGAACTGEDNRRLGQTRSLERLLPTLQDQDAVAAVLGEADRIELTNAGDIWIYCLGYNIIDFEFYVINFDALDQVTGFRFEQG